MWAHITLPFCLEWFHRKRDRLELCALFLVFSWGIISRSFLLWLSCQSHTYGRTPCFAGPSLKSGIWRASKLPCQGVLSAFKTEYVLNPAASLEGLQRRRTCKCGMMPSAWLHQRSRKLLSSDRSVLITWLLMTKAGRRVPMTFKRRLKEGVCVLKKLLQKRTKYFP